MGEKQRLISSCKMVIKETNDLKRLDTKYILNVKTLKHMYIAKFLLSGSAVAGMLYTCKIASRIIRNKIDTFAAVKKKEEKKRKNINQKQISTILTSHHLMKIRNNSLKKLQT